MRAEENIFAVAVDQKHPLHPYYDGSLSPTSDMESRGFLALRTCSALRRDNTGVKYDYQSLDKPFSSDAPVVSSWSDAPVARRCTGFESHQQQATIPGMDRERAAL